MSNERPLFQLIGVEMAADDGDITFALDVHGAKALNHAMNSFLEAAAEHAARHRQVNPPRRRREER